MIPKNKTVGLGHLVKIQRKLGEPFTQVQLSRIEKKLDLMAKILVAQSLGKSPASALKRLEILIDSPSGSR